MRAVLDASDPPLRRMTLDEWADLPEDEEGELVDGWLVEEEVPDFLHEAIVGWLLRYLVAWAQGRGGVAGGSDAKFAVATNRGRKPDITMFLPGRMPPRRGLVRVPPAIAVEVISSRPRDRRRDRLEILRRDETGAYVTALAASTGVLDDVPGCPELVLDLDELAAYLARLPRETDDDPTEI